VITVERAGEVALLRLEQGKVNALDVEVLDELVGLVDEMADDDETRAVVLTGAGKTFSAGVDLRRILDGGPDYATALVPAIARGIASLFTMAKPVVTAVNGVAIAGGCILACAGDVRLIAANARIGATELKVGVPFPQAALEVLRAACGERTEEAVYSGTLYDAPGAVAIGLAHEVVDPDELVGRALAAASELAQVPADVFRLTKAQLRRPAVERLLDEPVDEEVARIWARPATAAAIRASLERTTGSSGA